MTHLSSCYFCGTTLDDTLRDYRVVPAELRDADDTTTATLCQSCHGKLERLLAPVVAAAGADGATLDVPATTDRRESDEGATADPLLSDAGSDLVEIDEEPLTETGDAEPRDPPGGSDETADTGREGEHEEGDTGENGEDRAGETVRIRHETDDSGTDEGGETATGDGTDPESTDRAAGGDTDGGDTTGTGTGTGSGTREDTDTGGDTDDGGQSDAAQTTISALEYNKVMRLLQNRDFPVDRPEFVAMAANAYGLAEHECAEVIDLAVDRGLVAERDEQLVRPD